MAAVQRARDPPSATFMAGSYQFTRAQAQQLARLHKDGVPVRRLQEEFHSVATLKQVVVGIQVGIVLQSPVLNFDDLHPDMFDPQYVQLGMWKLGEFRLTHE